MLLTFYDFPTEHWKHIRTTTPETAHVPGVFRPTLRFLGVVGAQLGTGPARLLLRVIESDPEAIDKALSD